jgi:hypothetical protein
MRTVDDPSNRHYPTFFGLVIALCIIVSFIAERLVEWAAGGLDTAVAYGMSAAIGLTVGGKAAAGGTLAFHRKVAREGAPPRPRFTLPLAGAVQPQSEQSRGALPPLASGPSKHENRLVGFC